MSALARRAYVPGSGGGAGGAGTEFVYREGGVAGTDVYTSFLAAYTAAHATGIPQTIVVDDALSPGNAVTGAGAFDLSLIDLSPARYGVSNTILSISDGATISAYRNVTRLDLISLSATPVSTVAANSVLSLHSARLFASGAGKFFHVTAGVMFLRCYESSGLFAAASAVFDVDVGAFVSILAAESTTVQANTLTGAGSAFVSTTSPSVLTISSAQAGLGTFTRTNFSLAGNENYTDTAPLLVPTPALGAGKATTQESIDALKALLATVDLGSPGLRLSLTSGTPITTADVTGAATIYLTPLTSGRIALWSGAAWENLVTAQVSIALAGLTATNTYDVFAYNNAGVVTLELSAAWASASARTDALAQRNGVWVKNADNTRLYLGTFTATAATTTEDSQANRFLWNFYNQAPRTLKIAPTTDTWTCNSAVWRAANNSALNSFQYVCGMASAQLEADVLGLVDAVAVIIATAVGVGIDSTTVNSADLYGSAGLVGLSTQIAAHYRGYPGLGKHTITWLEIVGAGTVNFYGDAGNPLIYQLGMRGRIAA